jgi:hypothetical protein
MRKIGKRAYSIKEKRQMNKTNLAVALLVAATLVFSAVIPAMSNPIETMNMNEKEREDLDTTSTGRAVGDLSLMASTGQAPVNPMPVPFGESCYTMVGANGPDGDGAYQFDLEVPGTLNLLETNDILFNGGTWTCDQKWLVADHYTGALSEADPETGELTDIGGGGTGLNALAFDPTTNKLYGGSSDGSTGGLWDIDPETGDQEYIGDFVATSWVIGMACDSEGNLFGWDINPDFLYSINKDTGEATAIGSLGLNLNYAQDGAFHYSDDGDILYLTAYTLSPNYGGYLYTCDVETAECTMIGAFQGSAECCGSAIPFSCIPPEHDVGVKSLDLPEDGFATADMDIQVTVKNYGNHTETTDVQYEIIKCEAGPPLLNENFSTWVPTGWTHYGWEQSATNNAIGEVPEAYYGYYSGHYYSNGWIMTPPINATGFEKINVLFRLYADLSTYYTKYFYLQYRKNDTSPWRDVSPWDNPTGDIGPLPFEIGCYGWGEDLGGAFQARWNFPNPYYYLQYNAGIYLDDVVVEGCAGCAEYASITEDVTVASQDEVVVEFEAWTPSEWQNPDFEDTWEAYPLTSYTLLEDDNAQNDKKQRLLQLYYPYLHDVGAFKCEGPVTGPAQTFPVESMIKNVGQFDECCFKTYCEIAEIDYGSSTLLLDEDFYYYNSFPPSGWTRTSTKWYRYYSSYPGGSYPGEARFQYYPSETGEFRLYSGAMDTSTFGAVEIEFKHYLDHFSGDYTICVETSPDGNTWTEVWSIENPSGNQGPETVTFTTGDNVGSSTFHVSWTFKGYSWNVDYWHVDDCKVSGFPLAEPEYTDQYCCDEIYPGQEIDIQFDDWTPAFLAEGINGVKEYAIVMWTDLQDPMDRNHANDQIGKFVQLTFAHDIAIQGVNNPLENSDRKFYATDCNNDEFIWFDPEDPGTYNYIGDWPNSQFPQGGTFVDDETFWVCDTNGMIWYKHPDSPDVTEVGSSGTGGLVGLAYHEDSKTMYGMSTSSLYTIDMGTGAGTLVGPLGTGTLMISLDCDRDGVMYSYDLGFGTAKTYTIDLGTGAATPIGGTGVQVNYGQDMAYDWETETMFATIFNYGSFQGELHTIDLSTGAMTYVATLDSGAQTTCFGIPGGGFGGDTYVAPGTQAIEVIAENVGTFPETGVTMYGDIYEFITNCTVPTWVWSGNETFNLPTPLGGTHTADLGDYNFAVEGLYLLDLSMPLAGDVNINDNALQYGIGCDATAPVSAHTLDPATPDGANGYYVSDVTVTLSAYDPSIGCEVDGSGLKEIRYTVDGGPEQVIAGEGGSFVVTTDSTNHDIKYWGIDNVGNVEAKHTINFAQDQTVPNVASRWDAEQDEEGTWMVIFTITATDDTSGMDKVRMYINDGFHEEIVGPGEDYIFDIEWSPDFKTVTFKFEAYDIAGLMDYEEIKGADINKVPHVNMQPKQLDFIKQKVQPLG